MKYGLIGEKLEHSFSAEIHRQLYGYAYELKKLALDDLEEFIRCREFSAINVTIPYKEVVLPLLDEVDDVALKIGAINTVINCDGRLVGYNTDYFGLKSLIAHAGMDLTDKKVLILGSGGTAKTALAVVEDLGCRKALRVSRTVREGYITYQQAKEQFGDAEFIINTTPCGMYPHIGETILNVDDYPDLQGVVDVVYNPLRTKLVCDAIARGVPAVGGLYMLVAQAAYAGSLFTGEAVTDEKILTVYSQLLAQKQNIVLIGMPGCGKTTVGQVLAAEMAMRFIDTDEEIEQKEKRTISDIFQIDGERYFRLAESEVIKQVSSLQGCVIATGGGAVLAPNNMSLLRENGRICFLDRDLDNLSATINRPLSADRDMLEKLYKDRYSLYAQECDCHIPANGTVEMTVRQIREDLIK